MIRRLLAKLRPAAREGVRPEHASILVPFLIIAAALGVLAWRSYTLSIRMERGANTLAQQYAGYAAEITARRVDTAVRSELFRANDEWQHLERRSEPDPAAFRQWLNSHEWIVSAIYVPDFDPASSIYVSEVASKSARNTPKLTREFFTSSGTVRYTYDPVRLLDQVHAAVQQQPLVKTPGALAIQQQADVDLVANAKEQGLVRLRDGFAFTAALSPPLANWGVRAAVPTSYVGSGWENQRVISLWLSFFAMILTSVGAYLAWRGLHKEAETTKLRGALIANVSHELRTPLSMIRLGAETLRRGAKLSDKERHDIEDQILREVLHLSHLVENVLDVARMQHRNMKALAFTPVYPQDLIESLVSTYESWIRSKGFTVGMDLDEEIEEQLWDREAVSRALLNLIDNAIKYSSDDKRIEVHLRQTEEHVVLEVSDHGIGIDAREIQKIFDPYYRAQFSDTQTRRGAGLGLTLVQQIVASHGGRVEVESEPGRGSTFRLLFPRLSEEEERQVTAFAAREAF